jgi:LytS/YehU family sensor histidine kinase
VHGELALARSYAVLSLQPLLESACVHAVAPRLGRTTLRISARRQDDRLLLQVADEITVPQNFQG